MNSLTHSMHPTMVRNMIHRSRSLRRNFPVALQILAFALLAALVLIVPARAQDAAPSAVPGATPSATPSGTDAAPAAAAAADAAEAPAEGTPAPDTQALDEEVQGLKKDAVDLNRELFMLE